MTVADRTELDSVVPRPTEQTLPYPGTVIHAAIRASLGATASFPQSVDVQLPLHPWFTIHW